MKWEIFVPSKGRANNCRTAELAIETNTEITLVVEPQDEAAYRAAYEHKPCISFLILPKDNPGLPYVRNFVLAMMPDGWGWMVDDDLTGFYRVQRMEKKCIRLPMNLAFEEAEKAIKACQQLNPDLAQAALEYQQFAWGAMHKTKFNSYCDVVVAIDTRKTRMICYREGVFKEDRDFTLQLLSSGYKTARITSLAFSCPPNGSNKGGLYDEYKAGREAEGVRRMEELWPGIVTRQVKPNGRVDAKINWRHFVSRGTNEVKS